MFAEVSAPFSAASAQFSADFWEKKTTQMIRPAFGQYLKEMSLHIDIVDVVKTGLRIWSNRYVQNIKKVWDITVPNPITDEIKQWFQQQEKLAQTVKTKSHIHQNDLHREIQNKSSKRVLHTGNDQRLQENKQSRMEAQNLSTPHPLKASASSGCTVSGINNIINKNQVNEYDDYESADTDDENEENPEGSTNNEHLETATAFIFHTDDFCFKNGVNAREKFLQQSKDHKNLSHYNIIDMTACIFNENEKSEIISYCKSQFDIASAGLGEGEDFLDSSLQPDIYDSILYLKKVAPLSLSHVNQYIFYILERFYFKTNSSLEPNMSEGTYVVRYG
ncbi:hypothetical protein HK100_012366 [Physocladia obscura]|uniref:Uncharacterized protein n=1 Tax=Physocladia obscura TaxID=109957 RepID=A0AAD5T5V4_9FUNG|nr:hypothetical protein HK100_012366 [Physocladia obscura]